MRPLKLSLMMLTAVHLLISAQVVAREIVVRSIESSVGGQMQVASQGESSRAVILAHQYKGSWKSWQFFFPTLIDAGFRVYAFDFNGYGELGGWKKDRKSNHLDVGKVVELARSEGAETIILMGSSMGAAAVLKVALTINADAVVAMAPYHKRGNKFSNLAEGEAIDVSVPIYLFTAKDDTSYDHAVELNDLLPLSQLYVAEGNSHGFELLQGKQQQQVRSEVLDFLVSNSAR